jgi:hypothetical protein
LSLLLEQIVTGQGVKRQEAANITDDPFKNGNVTGLKMNKHNLSVVALPLSKRGGRDLSQHLPTG